MKIVILDGYTVVGEDLNWNDLREFGELTYYERTSNEDVIPRMKDADLIITSKCLINKEVIDSAPNLKYIGVIATGFNNVDIEYAASKGITVTNIPAYSTDSVAQFTFSLLLEAVNRAGVHNESVHSGQWNTSTDFCYLLTPQTELKGKTMGIVGYGNIGKKVAAIAKAFGMNVMVSSSHMTEDDSTDEIEFVSLDQLFSKSHIISLHCALTNENKEVINKETLGKMKNSAILINTSRGPLINEKDLAEALENKKISVAALDVLAEEPPRNGSPLFGLNNCIITPHMAWNTKEARQRLIGVAVNNVASFLQKKTVNKVN